ncbi:MAG: TlyA family RNA methyltransferase [Alphaproteobacteria bacterium]
MRADTYLVDKGYFESRAKAAAAIKAGGVSVNGAPLKKASQNIPDNAVIEAQAAHPWVSRGGVKLAHALEVFGVSAKGRVCLDVGASTGGFTDVLLSAGAARVYAVDVGRDQLHKKLRGHPKVVSMEATDARGLTQDMFTPTYDLIVCDASFISMMKVLERSLSLAKAGSELVTLVKPQFEVGRKNIGRGGIVIDNGAAAEALADVKFWLEGSGWAVKQEAFSPIKGGSGNTEYLLHAAKS